MNLRTILPLLGIFLPEAGRGAGFSTNFDSGYDDTQAVAGQSGWSINDSTPDLSFFVDYNTTNAAALGGYYNAPSLSSVRLSHGMSLPLVQTSLRMDFAVIPSTVSFPGRDAFGWSFFNASGSNLLTIRFEPDQSNPALLDVTWSTGGSASSSTPLAVQYEGPYSLRVDFSGAGGINAAFSATITGANALSFNGALPGLAGETLSSIGEDFLKLGASAGDNYMLFDNFAAVPEPSQSVFILSALALPLLARHRRQRNQQKPR